MVLAMKDNSNAPQLYCWKCGSPVKLVGVTPELGGMPRLETYRCTGCGDVQTIEVPKNPRQHKAASDHSPD
jgi:hypothetical protein